VYRTGATLRHAAAVFGTHQVQAIAQHPQQGRIGVYVNLLLFPVDSKLENGHKDFILSALKLGKKAREESIMKTIHPDKSVVCRIKFNPLARFSKTAH
jgi:hypothetical protein